MSENSKSAAEMLAMRALPPLKPKEEMMETLLSEMYGFPAPAPEKVSFENERDAVPGFCAGKARLDDEIRPRFRFGGGKALQRQIKLRAVLRRTADRDGIEPLVLGAYNRLYGSGSAKSEQILSAESSGSAEDPSGHIHDFREVEHRDADYENYGYTLYRCSCGEEKKNK